MLKKDKHQEILLSGIDSLIPASLPDVKNQSKAQIKKLKESATRWHDKIHDMSNIEFTGLMMAVELEKRARLSELFETDKPVINLGSNNKELAN